MTWRRSWGWSSPGQGALGHAGLSWLKGCLVHRRPVSWHPIPLAHPLGPSCSPDHPFTLLPQPCWYPRFQLANTFLLLAEIELPPTLAALPDSMLPIPPPWLQPNRDKQGQAAEGAEMAAWTEPAGSWAAAAAQGVIRTLHTMTLFDFSASVSQL